MCINQAIGKYTLVYVDLDHEDLFFMLWAYGLGMLDAMWYGIPQLFNSGQFLTFYTKCIWDCMK